MEADPSQGDDPPRTRTEPARPRTAPRTTGTRTATSRQLMISRRSPGAVRHLGRANCRLIRAEVAQSQRSGGVEPDRGRGWRRCSCQGRLSPPSSLCNCSGRCKCARKRDSSKRDNTPAKEEVGEIAREIKREREKSRRGEEKKKHPQSARAGVCAPL